MMDPEDEAAHEKGAKLAPAQHSARVHLPTSAPTSVSQRMSPTATCTSIISQPAAGRAIRIADTTQFRGIAAQRTPPSARPPFEPEDSMRTVRAYPVSRI